MLESLEIVRIVMNVSSHTRVFFQIYYFILFLQLPVTLIARHHLYFGIFRFIYVIFQHKKTSFMVYDLINIDEL